MTAATRLGRALSAGAWLLAVAALPLGCRYDPVPQEAIDCLYGCHQNGHGQGGDERP